MTRLHLMLAAIGFLAACQAGGQDHAGRLATEEAVTAALNAPGGPDYARAMAAVEAGRGSAASRDLAAGNLILSACRDGASFCATPNDVRGGVSRLARAASTSGTEGAVAAGHLATWYERGAGAGLPADPARSACWKAAADGQRPAAACTAR